QRLSALPLLTADERVLHAMQPGARRTTARSFSQLFEEAVDRTPDAVAAACGSHTLTYRELDAASNRVARWLRRRGVAPNTVVAFRVGRSLDMAIGFLGIVKAGGVFVPIDASYPTERTEYMLEDSRASLELVSLDHPEVAVEGPERVELISSLDDPAYIIYTS